MILSITVFRKNVQVRVANFNAPFKPRAAFKGLAEFSIFLKIDSIDNKYHFLRSRRRLFLHF